MQQKLIIDTDPGIDDAMAIHYAFAHPGLDVLGLTTSSAMYSSRRQHGMHCCCLNRLITASMWQGAAQPLVQTLNPPSHHVHGAEGFGDIPVKQPHGTQVEMSAADYIAQTCRHHSGEVILCPVGPLTNIAALLRADPELVNHVKRCDYGWRSGPLVMFPFMQKPISGMIRTQQMKVCG